MQHQQIPKSVFAEVLELINSGQLAAAERICNSTIAQFPSDPNIAGLLGALLALMLLQLSIFYLNRPLERLLNAYGNSFELDGLGGLQVVAVLLAGGILGFCGAWLSVQRYLRQLRVSGMIGRT